MDGEVEQDADNGEDDVAPARRYGGDPSGAARARHRAGRVLPARPRIPGRRPAHAAYAEKLDVGDFRKKHPRFTGENFQLNLRLADQVQRSATRLVVASAQVALARLLATGDDVVPIPDTKRLSRVEESAIADTVTLTPKLIATITPAAL